MNVIHRRALSLCTAAALCIPNPALALTNVADWAKAEVGAAQAAGLEPFRLAEADAEAPITRAEFAAIALQAYAAVSGQSPDASQTAPIFPDCDDPVVSAAFLLGLISGRSDGTFAPDATINRQELCVMLSNVVRAAGLIAASDGNLSMFADADTVDWWALDDVTAMVDHSVLSGVSTYGELTLDPFGTATRQQALILAGRFVSAFSGRNITPPPETTEYIPTLSEINADDLSVKDIYDTILTLPSTENEKMALVFGEKGAYFDTQEEAEAAMTKVEVKVWRLKSDGTKTPGTATIEVNAGLAPIVEQIFEEIYNGGEQFPIKNVGGYGWRSSPTSEHRWGTAIDINWEENFEADIGEDGELIATTGSYWRPGEDPYSIPADGDVVRAFKKYGFSWGGDAWTSKRDYMHFSFFGR